MVHPKVQYRPSPRLHGDGIAVHFGSSQDSCLIYDAANDEVTVQTKDASGTFQDRLRIEANTNTPDVDLAGNPVKWTAGRAVTAGDYSLGRDADGTNQLHLNVPTGASFELSINDSGRAVLDATGLGIGEASPQTALHLTSTSAHITHEDSDSGVNQKVWQQGVSMVGNGYLGWRTLDDDYTGSAQMMAISRNGVLGIDGNMSFPSTGTNGLVFRNGTALSGMGADTAGLYAADVASSSELFAIDEAGNASQLTPHNFSLFTPDPDYVYPWSYYAKNAYLGKEINVDMFGVVKAVERLASQRFIHLRDLPKEECLDWDEVQESHRVERESEIADRTARAAGLERRIKRERDPKRRAQLRYERDSLVIPEPATAKPQPDWIAVRKETRS